MIVIGVVGGIASGKSFVTRHLKSYGAVVLDADRIGHDVLLRESVKAEIHQRWGKEVFAADGQVDRGKLAAIVFDPQQPEQLHHLESITHPLIADELRAEIDRQWETDDLQYLVLDAPVMVKAGWHVVCNVIIFVDATTETRWRRASERGWSREMFDRRESMQATIERKREISSHVIDNNGSQESTIEQLDEFWKEVSLTTPPR